MFPALDESQYKAAGRILQTPDGVPLLTFVASKKLGRPIPAELQSLAKTAAELGWTSDGSVEAPLTPLGELVGDSCREYVHWLERGRTIHGQNDYPVLHPEAMKGLRVLELGCGSAVNLLTLQPHVEDLAGVDIVPVYLQMANLLFAVERLQPPVLVAGGAEQIPLDSNSRDLILMFGALQYTDINRVLRECYRVLDRNGRLITINGHFLPAVRDMLRNAAALRLRGTYSWAATVANTIAYQVTQVRLQRARANSSTSVPVYPTIRYLKSAAQTAGFAIDPDSRRTGIEYMLVARKS